jgi:hypothetical protein
MVGELAGYRNSHWKKATQLTDLSCSTLCMMSYANIYNFGGIMTFWFGYQVFQNQLALAAHLLRRVSFVALVPGQRA